MVVLALRPGDRVASTQLAVVTVAVLVGAAWGAAAPQLWNGLGLVVTVGLLAWAGGGRPVRWRRPDPVLSGLAVMGLVAAVVYGNPLARNTIEVEDITNGVSHYPMQASLAIAVAGLVGLAAVTRSRLPAGTAAFTAVWLGVESVVYPGLPGSLGGIGGALTVGWGVAVSVVLAVARRRADPHGG